MSKDFFGGKYLFRVCYKLFSPKLAHFLCAVNCSFSTIGGTVAPRSPIQFCLDRELLICNYPSCCLPAWEPKPIYFFFSKYCLCLAKEYTSSIFNNLEKKPLCFADQTKGCLNLRIYIQFIHNLINRNIPVEILRISIQSERIKLIYKSKTNQT